MGAVQSAGAARDRAPIALVIGVLTRLAALGIAVDMACAAILVHLPNGFFMNIAAATKRVKGSNCSFRWLVSGSRSSAPARAASRS